MSRQSKRKAAAKVNELFIDMDLYQALSKVSLSAWSGIEGLTEEENKQLEVMCDKAANRLCRKYSYLARRSE